MTKQFNQRADMRITIELESSDLSAIKSIVEAISRHTQNLGFLEGLGLTESTLRNLLNQGVSNIDALCRLTENDILKMPGIGRKHLNEINEKLFERGLSLA